MRTAHQPTRAGRVAYFGVLLTLAVVLGWVETLIPLPFGVPGLKLGLANAAVLLLLWRDGPGAAAAVNVARILLVNLLFGSPTALLYALFGAFLSLSAAALLRRTGRFGLPAVSAAAGVCHNIGQLAAACLLVGSAAPFGYLPVLIVAGGVCGYAVGLLSAAVLTRLPPKKP